MKKFIATLSAVVLAMTFSAGMTANAYSWESDSSEYSYDHNSDELDWSLWEDFLKYDLRITDFDSLDSEKQELCKFIYETEMLSKETIVCERARRIIAGEDVGERLSLETLQQYEYFGDYQWLYSEGIAEKNYNPDDNTYDLYYKYGDKTVFFCIPDIKHVGMPNYNEYWLDDEGTERIEYKGEYSGFYNYHDGLRYIDSDGNETYLEFEDSFEYRIIKYQGLTYKVYPDNTLCLISVDYDYDPYSSEWIFLPYDVNGMPITRIASGAFKDCPTKKVALRENIEYIEPFAFDNCPNLEEVSFPKSIKYIAPYAFNNCHKLGNLEIDCPDMRIYPTSFYECDIAKLKINARYVPYFKRYAYNNIDEVVILSGTKEIDAGYLMEDIRLPESVSIISGHIYYGENTYITVPEQIEILGAFDSIGHIYFGSGLDTYPKVPLLNKDYCIFSYVDDSSISGYTGTEAEKYAIAHNIKFIPLDDVPEDTSTIYGYYGSDEHKQALADNLKFIPLDDIEYGDVNRDGMVNVADIVLLQQYLYDSENYMVGYEADVNKDGYVDIFDIVLLRKMLFE